ncbi:Nitrate/nitrite response regulator protein [hydrothermal vent metagenome]|uniref:Nitrate/nitrite response regulator protein n=1 Tax=hydrothermal vent metagenome TaxID=652676 RepID=A0A1W1CIW4_9ZZZZ
MKKINIFLIDDHALFKNGLSSLLKTHNIKTTISNSIVDSIEQLKKTKFDIVLLDLSMPEMHGIEALKLIKKNKIQTPIAILTTSTNEKDLVECLKHGAQAYLLKNMEPDKLVDAIKDILTGSIVIAQEMTHLLANVLKDELSSEPKHSLKSLTPKEKEVICLIAEGFSNKVIAKELNITDGTVKLHVKSILKKLNLHSRVEAAVMVSKNDFC